MSPVFYKDKQGTLLFIDAEKCLTLGISKLADELISLFVKKVSHVLGFTYSRDSESIFSILKKKTFFFKKNKFFFNLFFFK